MTAVPGQPHPPPDGPAAAGGAPRDEYLLADLFDRVLQQLLDGDSPDPAALLPERPDLAVRVRETYDLACSVAGRREPSRPVLGGYEILRELGRGGMGTVYLARHEALGREVAIKVLPQSLALSPRAKRRFLEEARALARLRNEHIVHIHRIVDHAEMLAFEMEYVEGPSLQRLLLELREHGPRLLPEQLAAAIGPAAGPLGVRSAVEYFVKLGIAIARALAEVHRRGLVHRDVKPSNILLRKNGTPVLADFGLALAGDTAMTQTIAFAGTPIYAAPERLRFGDLGLDGRADVYSLGVTLYEAITLSPPYQGRSTEEVLRKIESGHIVPLRQRAPHVSKDLQTVLAKAMEPDPRHRYATAGDFADDLERLLALQPIHARPKGPVRRLTLALRRQRKVLLAGSVGALLVALALWPVFATVQAAASAGDRAAAHTHAARVALLQPPCFSLRAGGVEPGVVGRPAIDLQTHVAALRTSLAEYDQAMAIAPHDRQVATERAVLAMALWLRTESPQHGDEVPAARASDGFQALRRALPPVTQQVASALVGGAIDVAELQDDLSAATDGDRFATGLLTALVGEFPACEAAWLDLETRAFEHPLLNAGLGLLAAADGSSERAYPRLFHATRTFPTSRLLAFELAASALANGDLQLAERWLAETPTGGDGDEDPGDAVRRRRLEADVLAATGRKTDAEQAYREILRQSPTDSTARHRLAKLAMERGELERAQAYLQVIAQQWPQLAAVHLDLARIALRRHDRPRYLAEARNALVHCLAGDVSRSAQTQFWEILRLGGLRGLADELPAGRRDVRTDWRNIEPPSPPWASTQQAQRIEAALRCLATYDLEVDRQRRSSKPLGAALEGGVEVLRRYPHLLGAGHQGAVAVALLARVLLNDWILVRLQLAVMPFQRSLGTPLQRVPVTQLVGNLPGDPAQTIASALTTLGVVDGTQDFVLGISPVAADATGRFEVRSSVDGSLRCAVDGDDPSEIFAYCIADVGDLDRDGFADFAVGAPLRRRGSDAAGSVRIYSGRDARLLRRIDGDGIGFGVAIAALGDLDGDGVADLGIGTSPELRNSTALGAATIYSGASGNAIRTYRCDRAGLWFGAAVANCGDLDADGLDDLVVGGNNGGAAGLVRVFSSRNGALLWTLDDYQESWDFGRRVAGVGDIDGDRVPDVAVAAPEANCPQPRGGRVVLFSGRSGKRIATLKGDSPGDWFGQAICVLPDWRGDGRPAIAVGAAFQGVTGSGYVRVFDRRSLKPLQSFFLPLGGAMFGMHLANLGDRDGRGRPSLATTSLLGNATSAVWAFSYTLDGR